MKKKYILILPALLIMSVYFFGLISATLKMTESSVDQLKMDIRNGSILDFGTMVPGDWDRMCIITPYTSMEKAMKATGLNINRMKSYRMDHQDTDNLIIFSKGSILRKYFFIPRTLVDVEPKKIKSGGYDREEAIFMVETKEQGAFLAHMDDLKVESSNGKSVKDEAYAVMPGEPENIGGSVCTIRWMEKGYNKTKRIYRFSEGLMAIEKDGKWGYMDKNGRIVIPLMYDYAGEFSEGVAPVKLDQKYGGINWWNEIVIPISYDYMGEFSQGRALVVKKEVRTNVPKDEFGYSIDPQRFSYPVLEENHGFIDRKGNIIIPLVYEKTGTFSEGVVPVLRDGLWSIADLEGKILYTTVFDYVGSFSQDGIAVVKNEFGSGYMNKDGNLITPMTFDSAWDFSEGQALVEDQNGFHFINEQGIPTIKPGYDFSGGEGKFSEGRALVVKDRKYGYIDRYGSLDISYTYDKAAEFSEEMAGVSQRYNDDKWGYINKKNQKVVPIIFDEITPFSEGTALVRKGDRWGILYKP